MKQAKLQAIGENLLPAIGYGDSVGLPVETKSREEIQRSYGDIRALHSIDNPFLGQAVAGTWSDDTQLSLAVAEALIEAKDFTIDTQVKHHVKALDESSKKLRRGEYIPLGWGPSTFRSVNRLKYGTHGPSSSGSKSGQGNGVLMKLAPLALWQSLMKPENQNDQISAFTRMTHDNELSVVTSLVHRDILGMLLKDVVSTEDLFRAAEFRAKHYERRLNNAGDITSSLLGKLASYKSISADGILEIAPGGGFHSPETLVMAYGAFRRSWHYPESVYEAVNLGGDTDSIGSIVAAMSVMHDGANETPHDIEWLVELPRLRKTSRALIQMITED